MSKWMLFCPLILITANLFAGDAHELVFHADGTLLSPPPTYLAADDALIFAVKITDADELREGEALAASYLSNIENLNKAIENIKEMFSSKPDTESGVVDFDKVEIEVLKAFFIKHPEFLIEVLQGNIDSINQDIEKLKKSKKKAKSKKDLDAIDLRIKNAEAQLKVLAPVKGKAHRLIHWEDTRSKTLQSLVTVKENGSSLETTIDEDSLETIIEDAHLAGFKLVEDVSAQETIALTIAKLKGLDNSKLNADQAKAALNQLTEILRNQKTITLARIIKSHEKLFKEALKNNADQREILKKEHPDIITGLEEGAVDVSQIQSILIKMIEAKNCHCTQVKDLVDHLASDYASFQNKDFFLKKLDDQKYGACPDTCSVPAHTALLKPDYTVHINRYTAAGVLIAHPLQATLTEGNGYRSDPQALNLPGQKQTARITYELRRNSKQFALLAAQDFALDNDFQEMIKTKKKKVAALRGRLTGSQPLVTRVKAHLSAINAGLTPKTTFNQKFVQDVAKNLNQDQALAAIKDILTDDKTGTWIGKAGWFTAGNLTFYPFPNPGVVAAQIKTIEARLQKLGAAKEVFDLLAEKSNLEIMDIDKSDFPGDIAALADQRAEILDLTKQRNALKAKHDALTHGLYKNRYLYGGGLRVSGYAHASTKQINYMRFHDAEDHYQVMSPKMIREITEDARLYIQVENEKPTTQLELETTVTAITEDASLIEDELSKSDGDADTAEAAKELKVNDDPANVEDLKNLVEAFAKADKTAKFGEAFLAQPASYRFAKTPDPVPDRITREVAHETPNDAPAKVAYTIKKGTGATAKVVAENEYRYNKLYRLRFRLALAYSELEETSIMPAAGAEADPTAIAMKSDPAEFVTSSERHGVDTIFGVQVFTKKRDIRQNKAQWWPVLFAGFGTEPTKDLFFGGGFEPIGGLSVLVGRHWGKGDELRGMEPDRQVVSDIHADAFIAVSLDVGLFKKLFGLKNSFGSAD